MTTHQVVNRHNLELANRLINDDVPTMVQMFTNPLDEVFNKPYGKHNTK